MKKYERRTYWNYHSRYPNVDWEVNHRRAKRIDQLVRESRLKRQDIARHVGLLPQDLSRLLRSKTVPLGPVLALRIEQAVDLLLRRTPRVDWEANHRRAKRIDQLVRESRLK
ncbi:MAG: hypothetical protein OXU26_18110, partial [Acidobacteriota bacterium]|nr:hypothetical protein [Acidobacteriota bacterium]